MCADSDPGADESAARLHGLVNSLSKHGPIHSKSDSSIASVYVRACLPSCRYGTGVWHLRPPRGCGAVCRGPEVKLHVVRANTCAPACHHDLSVRGRLPHTLVPLRRGYPRSSARPPRHRRRKHSSS
eukprot:350033-Chlamydomonas_euryale.AAC.11